MRYKLFMQPILKLRYSFFIILFFIEGIWNRTKKKKEVPVCLLPTDGDEQWLEEGEVKISAKPAKSDILGNQAKFGWSQIPKPYRKTVAWCASILIFFLLFGIVNFIWQAIFIIQDYPIIGWGLLDAICAYILFRIGKKIYKYFKEKKYSPYIIEVKIMWEEATLKSLKKYPY